MFNQNTEEEKKLDWMYKGPTSNVSREEYLLGRPVDKPLEQLNEEEKLKQQGLLNIPKNRVEHECIPPSIRDFNKLVQSEQVDLSTKLQEDPLVAIKKREEETRRQFLQNPVQLKKLQKALKAQQAKKKKKKKKSKSSDSDSDLEKKLKEKLLGKKSVKISKDERNLDIILIHKYEALKDKLSESDLQDILNGKITDSDDSGEDEAPKKKPKKKRRSSSDDRQHEKRRNKNDSKRRDEQSKRYSRSRYDDKYKARKERDRRSPSSSSESDRESKRKPTKQYDSDDSDAPKAKNLNYGLVTSDGKKIPLSKKYTPLQTDSKKTSQPSPPRQKHKAKRLTDEEKEKLREEMMRNAVKRDKERERNVRKYREKEEQEKKEQKYDPEFVNKQYLKSANSSSIESRIKSNLNNIQRSSRDMDRNFSRR